MADWKKAIVGVLGGLPVVFAGQALDLWWVTYGGIAIIAMGVRYGMSWLLSGHREVKTCEDEDPRTGREV